MLHHLEGLLVGKAEDDSVDVAAGAGPDDGRANEGLAGEGVGSGPEVVDRRLEVRGAFGADVLLEDHRDVAVELHEGLAVLPRRGTDRVVDRLRKISAEA